MAVYALNFALFAAGNSPGSPIPGFLCAFYAVVLPLDLLRS